MVEGHGISKLAIVASVLSAVVPITLLSTGVFAGNEKDHVEDPIEAEVITAQVVRRDVVTQTVTMPDGKELRMVTVFPNANPEFVCVGFLGPSSTDVANVTGGGCFPAKTNPSPTMY